jgi:hypothetical protein
VPVAQAKYLAEQARQLQVTQTAAAAPSLIAPAALLIQSEAQLQRSIGHHSPTAARVPSASTRGFASHDLVSVKVDESPDANSGDSELLFWHDISGAGKEEGFVSSSGRFIAHFLVGLFALFYMMHEFSSGDYQTWPIRADTNNIRISWWWTFSPLLVLDFFCLLSLPSFFVTLSRNGFIVAARRASQRSGFLSLILFGNPCLMVSELVLISNLAEPSTRHISHTAFYVFAPCLIGAIFLIFASIAALVSTSSQSAKAPSVSFFAGVCTCTFCIICPLRIGDQIAWSWWAIMCPMFVLCLVWALSACMSIYKMIREMDINDELTDSRRDSAAAVYYSKWSVSVMLLVDSICFGMFFVILAAVLDGWAPVSGNLRLAVLPVYAATGLNCLSYIVSLCLRVLLKPSWLVMSSIESMGDGFSDPSSPLSLSASSGSAFVQEPIWMRGLHVITLLLLAFQVSLSCCQCTSIIPLISLLTGHLFDVQIRRQVLRGRWRRLDEWMAVSCRAARASHLNRPPCFCRIVSSSWWVILLPSFGIDILAIIPLFSAAATAREAGPQAAIKMLLQRPAYILTFALGNPFCACFHLLLAESLHTTRGATLIWPLMHLATPLYVPALLLLLASAASFFTSLSSRISSVRWLTWSAVLICAITLIFLRAQDVVIANGPPAPVRPPFNISNPNATWHASVSDCSTPFNCAQIAPRVPSWSVAFVPIWSLMLFSLIFNIFDLYKHTVLFTFGTSKACRTVFHIVSYGISAIFLALYLDRSIQWPLAWVLSPVVLHAAAELVLLALSVPLSPRPPTGVKVSCSDGNATVTWSHQQVMTFVPVRFIVDLKPDRSDMWLRKHVGRECSFTISNLPPSRTFSVRVITQNPSGAMSDAVLSEPFTILHRMPPKPEPPRALKFVRQIRRNKLDSRDISVSLLAVVAWSKAEEGASFTLEAATLLSDESAWRVIYTGPLLETRVPNIPPTTAFKMRLTVRVGSESVQ